MSQTVRTVNCWQVNVLAAFICFAANSLSLGSYTGYQDLPNRALVGRLLKVSLAISPDGCFPKCCNSPHDCPGVTFDSDTFQCLMYKDVNGTVVESGKDSKILIGMFIFGVKS